MKKSSLHFCLLVFLGCNLVNSDAAAVDATRNLQRQKRAGELDAFCLRPTGQFAYPPDCSKFVNCWAGGTTALQDCTAGTLFSPALGTCDYIDAVQCASQYNQGWIQGRYPSQEQQNQDQGNQDQQNKDQQNQGQQNQGQENQGQQNLGQENLDQWNQGQWNQDQQNLGQWNQGWNENQEPGTVWDK